jgi:DNA-binding response OmpR family regulator
LSFSNAFCTILSLAYLNVVSLEPGMKHSAASGADGLRVLSEGQEVDLVLLDYMMPGMTGKQVDRRGDIFPSVEQVA